MEKMLHRARRQSLPANHMREEKSNGIRNGDWNHAAGDLAALPLLVKEDTVKSQASINNSNISTTTAFKNMMFPIWVGSSGNSSSSSASTTSQHQKTQVPAQNSSVLKEKDQNTETLSAPPPIPKKIRIEEEDETAKQRDEENAISEIQIQNGNTETFDSDAQGVIERTESQPTTQGKRGRATLAPSEGLALRGVISFRASEWNGKKGDGVSKKEPPALVRHASSNGSSREDSQGTREGSSGGMMSSIANRLARTDVRFAEIKNKLNEANTSLAQANKRIEELERENERINRENRDLRRKLDAQNTNGTSRAKRQGSDEIDDTTGNTNINTIRVENLDKSMTSQALLQIAEMAGEVMQVRIMRVPSTGVVNGYCSFATQNEALKAVEHFRKTGYVAISVQGGPTSTDKRSSAAANQHQKRWRN